MSRDAFQPRCSLLDYLAERGWKPTRDGGGAEVAGLCPLHPESRPSFYVNRRKQVFYCHGCGRGGGLARLAQLLEGLPLAAVGSGQPLAPDGAPLLEQTYAFYQRQLPRFAGARAYLAQRGIHDSAIIGRMRIGYAPGACLRGHLARLGYGRQQMAGHGLIDGLGRDTFFRCLTFPLPETGNLYGRSIEDGVLRHRFLPRPKGGLYGWAEARAFSSLILAEGLLDVAALWQAGFANAVAAMGAHLNAAQLAQLCGPGRRVYVCLDADRNGSGPSAARWLCARLASAGVEALRVLLPAGHDPSSFFAAGAGGADFQRCLDRARP